MFHFYTLSAISDFCPQTTAFTFYTGLWHHTRFYSSQYSGVLLRPVLRCCFITLDSIVPIHSVQRSTEVNSLGTSVTMVKKNWSVKSSKSHWDSGKNDWGAPATFTCLPPLNKTLSAIPSPRYYKHVFVLLCACSNAVFSMACWYTIPSKGAIWRVTTEQTRLRNEAIKLAVSTACYSMWSSGPAERTHRCLTGAQTALRNILKQPLFLSTGLEAADKRETTRIRNCPSVRRSNIQLHQVWWEWS